MFHDRRTPKKIKKNLEYILVYAMCMRVVYTYTHLDNIHVHTPTHTFIHANTHILHSFTHTIKQLYTHYSKSYCIRN